ncbi:MAG: NADH-quinone oxidoreductase subunit A [Deltaproteobacteria bacterium]|nr:NADH-quinone oxidoreductase subunit A [Deltaproteobacteria bacterium]
MDAYTLQYSALGVFIAVAVIFPLVPLFLSSLIAPKKPSSVKQSAYECGLESHGDPWGAFKVNYYVYALVFVAFDLEAPFLYAWAVVFHGMGVVVFVEMMVFVAVLVAGLAWAWKKGVLEWR